MVILNVMIKLDRTWLTVERYSILYKYIPNDAKQSRPFFHQTPWSWLTPSGRSRYCGRRIIGKTPPVRPKSPATGVSIMSCHMAQTEIYSRNFIMSILLYRQLRLIAIIGEKPANSHNHKKHFLKKSKRSTQGWPPKCHNFLIWPTIKNWKKSFCGKNWVDFEFREKNKIQLY